MRWVVGDAEGNYVGDQIGVEVVETPGDHGAPVVGEDDDGGDVQVGEKSGESIGVRFEAVDGFGMFGG